MSVFKDDLFQTWNSQAVRDFDEYTIAAAAAVEHQ